VELSDSLKEKLYAHIDQVKYWNHSEFDGEVDFIDKAVSTLDNFDEAPGDQRAQVKAKKMHPSPKVSFDGPDWAWSTQAKNAADHIANTDAELADIMVVMNRFEGDQVVGRRVTLSQTKFSKRASDSPWKWKIKMHQYHLLHELPEITFVEPATGESFNLDPVNKTFTSYSFASDFDHGFFNSTGMAREFMSSVDGVKSTTYGPKPDAPYGFQVFRGMLKRFILGMYGEEFEVGDEVSNMIQHMYDEATFTHSTSENDITRGGNFATDGGYNMVGSEEDDEDTGMAVIQVDMGEDIQAESFDQLDEEGPRL
jgi:hypothetical protein